MQLSASTSPDPSLATLLLPTAVGSEFAPGTPEAVANPAGFAALLADATMPMGAEPVSPEVPAPDLAPPPATAPMPGQLSAPRAWPFVSVRPMPAEVAAPVNLVTDEELPAAETDDVAATVTPSRPGQAKISPAPIRPARKEEPAPVATPPSAVALLPEFLPLPLVAPAPAPELTLETSVGESADAPLDAEMVTADGRDPAAMLPTAETTPVVPSRNPPRWVRPDAASGEVRTAAFATRVPTEPNIQLTDDDATFEAPAPSPKPVVLDPVLRARTNDAEPAIPFSAATRPAEPIARDSSALQSPLDEPKVVAARAEAPRYPAGFARPMAEPAPVVTATDLAASSASEAPASPAAASMPSPASVRGDTPPATTAANDTAKIAVNFEPPLREDARRENAPTRNFVSANMKQLTSRHPELGTSVAKSEAAMPSATTLPRPTHAAFESASLLVDRGDAANELAPAAPAEPTFAPAAASTAQRAVEAVLTAAHRYSTGERHSVSLQFSVGGADLSVRVELRADEVRATFKTDSAELRAALSQEWQSAAATGGERGLRLATPVFAGHNASGFSAFSGDHTSQQQHRQPAARQPEAPFTLAASRAHTTRDAASLPSSISAAAPRIPNSTALHLHTLA